MKLLFGIGNPGKEYEGTRHNVGHDFVMAANGEEHFLCVTSDVFVNQSGPEVKKYAAKHKLKADSIIIVHDDLDIEFGKFKISFDRNSAGHKGVQSIITALKTKKFWRLRIGIANAKLKSARAMEVVPDFVLSRFTPTERAKLPELFKNALHDLAHHVAHA